MTISGLEMFDRVQREAPRALAQTAALKKQIRSALSSDRLRRYQQNGLTQRLRCAAFELWRQTQSLEPVEEAIGERQQLEVGSIGEEVAGRHQAHRSLANVEITRCT